jgi:pimeloyl-ACP methyl ester carboxylesterase
VQEVRRPWRHPFRLQVTAPRPSADAISDSFDIDTGPVSLSGERLGDGPPVVLLHGLTATRRYVTHGSKLLPRSGYETFAYDARGHGESAAPEDESAYEYADLAADLGALLDTLGLERAALVGSSMGAATAMRFAVDHPERVSALVQVTPAYDGERIGDDLDDWGRLADGLDSGGVDGFLAAYDPPVVDSFRETVMTFTRQRLERHRNPHAVACALRVVPGSRAFEGLETLEGVHVPTLIVASRDGPDPGHPLAVGKAYAEYLPDAELLVEDEGKSPIAWQGAQLSGAIADFLQRQQIG